MGFDINLWRDVPLIFGTSAFGILASSFLDTFVLRVGILLICYLPSKIVYNGLQEGLNENKILIRYPIVNADNDELIGRVVNIDNKEITVYKKDNNTHNLRNTGLGIMAISKHFIILHFCVNLFQP